MNEIPYRQIEPLVNKEKIPSKPETSTVETRVQNDRCAEVEGRLGILHWINLVQTKFERTGVDVIENCTNTTKK